MGTSITRSDLYVNYDAKPRKQFAYCCKKKKGEKEKHQAWVCWSKKKKSLSALLNVCSLDALGGQVHLGFKCFTILCLGVPVDLNKSECHFNVSLICNYVLKRNSCYLDSLHTQYDFFQALVYLVRACSA